MFSVRHRPQSRDGALRELAGSDIRISKLRGGAVCRTCDGGQPQQQSEFPHDNLFINLNSNIPSADTALSARRAAPEHPDTTAYSATPRTIRTLSGSCRGSVSGASAHPPRRNPHRIRHTPASSPPGYPRRLRFAATGDTTHPFARHLHREVVEHDAVGPPAANTSSISSSERTSTSIGNCRPVSAR